jgi:uncharacterized repeat protein (TIGR01451 family)
LESLEARQLLSASPTLVSTASSAAGNVVGSAIPQDSAVLSGGNQETGSLTFRLIAPDSSVVDTETVQVNGDRTYQTSNTNVATQVGTYTWQARYAGDSQNDPASDQGGPAEQISVVQASPTLVSTASFAAGNVVGTAIPVDSVVLSGGFQESGLLTFKLTAPDNSVVDTETIAPNGDGTYATSNVIVATQVGTYTWAVSYAGDGFNNAASDQGGAADQLTTVKASPTITTSAGETAGGVVGTAVLSDSVTVSGGDNPTGTVTFTLTAPDGTTSTVGSVTVSGDSTCNAPTVLATEVGTYNWHANYSGDGLNNGVVDNGTNESITTIKASPTIITSSSETAGGVVGSSVLSDSVTVSGGDNPTGTVTFTLTRPDGTVISAGSVSINADGTYSDGTTILATQVGTYTWHASYGGDGLNNSAVDNGVNESLSTIKASPSITTSASETANGVVGRAVLSDSVTVSGGDNPTGTVTFTLTRPDGTVISAGSVSISGDGTYSDGTTVIAAQVGTYAWHAIYSGDGLNNGAVDNGVNESLTALKASPTLVTTASFKSGTGNVVGTAIPEDSAVLSGGYQESGKITFKLTAPDGTVADTETVTPNGDGTYTTSNAAVATQGGIYTWTVTYAGDGLNNAAHDQGGTAEELYVFKPGTWTPLAPTNPSAGPTSGAEMNLLSDGTVIVQSGQIEQLWYKLTPSASGSYVNGTWSQIAPMNFQRMIFSTAVLPSGQVIAVGGEYYGPNNTPFTNVCEMYDPVHNTWSYIASAPSPTGTLGECDVEVLPDGRVLAADKRGPAMSIYNPATNTWVLGPNRLRGDWNDEETWVKLPDNSILSYDIWSSAQENTFHAQRYIPDPNGGIGTIVDASNVDPTNPPSLLSKPGYLTGKSGDDEIGPGFLQNDGRVIQFGALGDTAIYNPATNLWSAGPAEPTRVINGVPEQLTVTDGTGAVLPNGNILVTFKPEDTSISGVFTYEYDPITQTFTDVTPPNQTAGHRLMLPNGQVFLAASSMFQIYTPSGTAPTSSRPTISAVANNGNGTYTLSGTQLNGISEGADMGDDAGLATNFPIVQLTSTDGSGHVYYAKTTNWSSTGVATGSTPVTTSFTLPAYMPYGTYSLSVIANGIASAPVSFTGGLVGPSADLGLTNNGPLTSTEGSNVTYSLTVTNNGPTAATNVVMTDTLGANLKYVSATTGQGTFTQSGSKVTFSFGTVVVGQTVTATVTAQTLEDGNLTNYASVTSSLSDANQNNNSGSATTVVAEPAISVSGSVTTTSKKLNNVIVATFTHANGVEPASAFTATINWGDGSTSAGTISLSGITYSVKGSHSYAVNGTYTITTTVTEPTGSGGTPSPSPGGGPGKTATTPGASFSNESSAQASFIDRIFAEAAGGIGSNSNDWLAALPAETPWAGADPVTNTDPLDALFERLGNDSLQIGDGNGLWS